MSEKIDIAKKEALRVYRAEAKKVATPLSPAKATKAAAAKSGLTESVLVPVVAAIFYAENGRRWPISAKGPAALAKAIRSRRDKPEALAPKGADGKPFARMNRWEVIAASCSAGLGRTVSIAAVKEMYTKAGGDLSQSYSGRGTRKAVPATRESAAAEVEAVA